MSTAIADKRLTFAGRVADLKDTIKKIEEVLESETLTAKERSDYERELTATKSSLSTVESTMRRFGDFITDRQFELLLLELNHLQINSDTQWEIISDRLNGIDCRLDGHDEEIRGINTRLDSLVGGLPVRLWLIAGFIGIVVGAIWSGRNFNSVTTSKNITLVTTSHLSSNWVAAFVGLLAAVFTVVVYLCIIEPLKNKRSNRSEASSETKDTGKKSLLRGTLARATTEAPTTEPVATATAATS